jgi:hypothetical protein
MPKSVTYEYHVIELDDEADLVAALNDLGSQGWLLVGVTDFEKIPNTTLLRCFLVRET